MVVIDYTKPKGYKTKDWIAMETLQENSKGKITKWRASGSKEFTEVKNSRLFIEGTPVKRVKMGGTMTEKWVDYRYGKYGQHSVNKDHIDYLKKLLKPFKL